MQQHPGRETQPTPSQRSMRRPSHRHWLHSICASCPTITPKVNRHQIHDLYCSQCAKRQLQTRFESPLGLLTHTSALAFSTSYVRNMRLVRNKHAVIHMEANVIKATSTDTQKYQHRQKTWSCTTPHSSTQAPHWATHHWNTTIRADNVLCKSWMS